MRKKQIMQKLDERIKPQLKRLARIKPNPHRIRLYKHTQEYVDEELRYRNRFHEEAKRKNYSSI